MASRRRTIGAISGIVLLLAIVGTIVAVVLTHQDDGNRSPLTAASSVSTNAQQQVPTIPPSNVPSLMPSMGPSDIPSSVPSLRPSLSPSNNPTMRPSLSPSDNPTASPTNTPVSPDFSFRLKLYWEKKFFWQEEYVERKWCLECTTCRKITASDFGEGCRDSDKNQFKCRNGDQLWIQRCDRNSGNAVFQVMQHKNGVQIKARGTNLCLQRVNPKFINMQPCRTNEEKQMWTGFSATKPFVLHPVGKEDQCMSQHHHPKASEIVFAEQCYLADRWNTALWEAI